MLPCFTLDATHSIPIYLLTIEKLPAWLKTQDGFMQQWLQANQFTAKPEQVLLVPNPQGTLACVLCGIVSEADLWSVGSLATLLPVGRYHLNNVEVADMTRHALAWGLGAYQFQRYKLATKTIAQLVLPVEIDHLALEAQLQSFYWVRDLINTPAEDMGPQQLAESAQEMAAMFNARFSQIIDEDLLVQNYPSIYTVGRASTRPPRLVDIRWGEAHHPLLTLVGKGVCFDTGGLDLKSASGMLTMKKDMGGAAHALGLARLIMAAKLPVQLRVLIPCVDNVIAGNAYKPSDIIKTRKGLTVEVTNTDAEGRLVLCDALAEAASERPRWLLDFATLTGAARIALGADIAAFFTHFDDIATDLMQHSVQQQDPIWRLPLYSPYRKLLDSPIADLVNTNVSNPYGGAINAGLFLSEFVGKDIAWIHFDIMAANQGTRPGRPEGGEAQALRAVFSAIQAWSNDSSATF